MPSHRADAQSLLRSLAGPASELTAELLPRLFRLTCADGKAVSPSLRSWKSHFGAVVGVSSKRLDSVVNDWSLQHGCPYADDPAAWLFGLHTWLGLVLRLVAAFSLPRARELLSDTRTPLHARMAGFESGELFVAAGVANLRAPLSSWYLEPRAFSTLEPHLAHCLQMVADATERERAHDLVWTGDAFRGLYEGLVPQDLRHALGEVYTPDALAARALDKIQWLPTDSLLDPTCGMGTFLLEALGRRLEQRTEASHAVCPSDVLQGLWGFDINPLAVVAARAALALKLAPWLDPARPAVLPVYMADVIRLASPVIDRDEASGWSGDPEDLAAARAVPRIGHIAGNPPWVRWSQLPPEYAAAIRPACAAVNVFSRDRYVGGIEADMSAVITHLVAARWLAPGGRMAFFLPAALFSTEAGEGFRRLRGHDGAPIAAFELVEDLRCIRPFEGVSAPATLVVLRGGEATKYPVPYQLVERLETDAGQKLWATPIPGSDGGPWLRGEAADHALWAQLFDASLPSSYRARKGVTTDCNGVYFVRVLEARGELLRVENDPDLGRKAGIDRVASWIERTHVFPLLRGRGLVPFRARVDSQHGVIVPQRGMHGDPELEVNAPLTWQFLRHFEAVLRERGSYRRYQAGKPFWSTWSTGEYTFAPWKVLWREMSGARFFAAAAGPHRSTLLGERPAVPDHKLYFVPVDAEGEAHYLAGLLNAPSVARAVSSYAAQLSLGVSVMESLRIPRFAPDDPGHASVAALARTLAASEAVDTDRLRALDALALGVLGVRPRSE